jgi:catalase
MANPSQPAPTPDDPLARDLLQALDNLFGVHPGFRAAHAKGIMCAGTFTPAPRVSELTRAPHANRPSTPVIVRFSDFAGVPVIPDNAAEGASPRGIAIRFNLADHVHTDIVGHSTDGFPVRTGEEFLSFARAIAASGPNAPHPTAIESFLGSNPAAMRFVMAPKPIPTSFARESFFPISAFRFTNQAGASRYGKYKILPDAGNEYLGAADAAKKSPNFLMEEMTERLAAGPVRIRIAVQLGSEGDNVSDSTAVWPVDRPTAEFGTITLTKRVNELDPEMRKIIFDPRPRVDGIEASDDPLFEVRAAIYLLSGRRRRAAAQ